LEEVEVATARLAKLSAPRTSNWIARTRLHRLLDRTAQQAAVWIAAGPGSGKSTLAACWAAARGPRTLWYRADAGDCDPGAAFGYFAQLARATRRARRRCPPTSRRTWSAWTPSHAASSVPSSRWCPPQPR
jgi:ATP/maltotriose-dependent transcriptional regulator MalT